MPGMKALYQSRLIRGLLGGAAIAAVLCVYVMSKIENPALHKETLLLIGVGAAIGLIAGIVRESLDRRDNALRNKLYRELHDLHERVSKNLSDAKK
jgi:hypothetical protein